MLLSGSSALANVHDTFGVGSASIALGNAQTASVKGGAAAYYNPAALGKTNGMQVDAGFQMFIPRFADFDNIVYDRNQNGTIDMDAEGNPETTSVAAQYLPTAGMALNASIPITKWAAFGISAYIPAQHLM